MDNNYKQIKIFSSSIWHKNYPELLYLNKHCDAYIKKAKKETGNKFGEVNHSTSLTMDNNFKPLTDAVGNNALWYLDNQGFDMSAYTMMFTELWVQEFTEKGGGAHETHVHYNQHVSGFYFLKCGKDSSFPLFHDPRPGALMTKLKEKDKNQMTDAISTIQYKPEPGDMVIFNGYLPHSFVVDLGKTPFRFIHFNLQAFPKQLING